MKILLALTLLFVVGCSTQKSKSAKVDAEGADSVSNAVKDEKFSTPTKNVTLNNQPKPDSVIAPKINTTSKAKEPGTGTISSKNSNATSSSAGFPSCIQNLISVFKQEDVQNPPRKIYSYVYKGQTVFYVTPPCCDFFSDLYDSNCKLIAHPDGGITGKGDRRAPDFIETRTNEKLVWEDKRKY